MWKLQKNNKNESVHDNHIYKNNIQVNLTFFNATAKLVVKKQKSFRKFNKSLIFKTFREL